MKQGKTQEVVKIDKAELKDRSYWQPHLGLNETHDKDREKA